MLKWDGRIDTVVYAEDRFDPESFEHHKDLKNVTIELDGAWAVARAQNGHEVFSMSAKMTSITIDAGQVTFITERSPERGEPRRAKYHYRWTLWPHNVEQVARAMMGLGP